MANTQEVLDRLPKKVLKTIGLMKEEYEGASTYGAQREYRGKMQGYVDALEDLEVVSDRERGLLYIYMTL